MAVSLYSLYWMQAAQINYLQISQLFDDYFTKKNTKILTFL